MKNVQIFDDFLEKEKFNALQENIFYGNIPWSLSNEVSSIYDIGKTRCEDKYNYQFIHTFFDNGFPPSPAAHFLNSFLEKLDPILLIRAKVNINPSADKIIQHGMHIDVLPYELAEKCSTCVFYLNSNNGYTEFEDGTIVQSLANRLLVFPSAMYHSGSTCTDAPYRSVLNVNFILQKSDVSYMPERKKK